MNSEQESKAEQLAKEIWRQTIGKERGITDKGVAAPKTHAPPAVSSGEWVEELATRLERRACAQSLHESRPTNPTAAALMILVEELRACSGSSSTVGDQRPMAAK
jgi:hypothetical protein